MQSLKNIDASPTAWEKIVTSTPVVLAVVATILAGLSSSESSLAQYHRALSAQNQSKAADQWAFFQAKRTRAEEADNTQSLLAVMVGSTPAGPEILQQLAKWAPDQSATMPGSFDPANFSAAIQKLTDSTDAATAAQYLSTGLPTVQDQPLNEPGVESAMKLTVDGTDASAVVKTLSQEKIDHALSQAQINANNFDAATKPITAFIEHLAVVTARGSAQAGAHAGELKNMAAEVTASRLSWNSRRDLAEAKYNQTIANILEVEVQYTSLDSDRHRDRSKFFFYGMLAAQAGVTISTLSLAVKKRSFLWAAASLVGLGAIAYAAYIYLFT